MEITDCLRRPLRACLTFEYRGLIVSASTVFTPNSVMVFKKGERGAAISKELSTIPAAIAWINRNHKRFA